MAPAPHGAADIPVTTGPATAGDGTRRSVHPDPARGSAQGVSHEGTHAMAATDSARGDDVYQPDGGEIVDDSGILDAQDTLTGREADPYDEGWSPPERALAVDRVGTTAEEQRAGESLAQRLSEELPDPALDLTADVGDGIGDVSDTDGEPRDGEVGATRSGRLTAPSGRNPTTFAEDVGIDGAAASAEEAAVHIIPADGEFL
ncbi:hypothetical protein GCM10010495_81220 [Kitasatospora herbaricolor]|nr:hypothetical protein GCM10010495_81220 [Kitasatospora herbaricolor]